MCARTALRLFVSSTLVVACATGVEPEGNNRRGVDAGSGSGGIGGSAGTAGSVGTGGAAGVLGGGAGGSAAFGAGGNLGASGASGTAGTDAGSFGGTLGSSGTSAGGTSGTGAAAGTAGSSGSAGTTGTGGSGGTAPVKPCTAAVSDGGTGVVKLQMRNNEDASPTNNEIKPILNLVNLTGAAIPLTELKIRYWYSKEPSAPGQNLVCDYAVIGNANIDTGNDVAFAVDAAKPGANWYFEVKFTGGSLPANSSTGDIKLRFHTEPFQDFSEVDDYSYCQATTLTDWDRVAVYRGGNLVWGAEP
jgi:hypothetical protein